MEWKKFNEQYPPVKNKVLYFDGIEINMVNVSIENKIYLQGIRCDNPRCMWVWDDSDLEIIIEPHHYWMPLPNQPERSKREDSQNVRCGALNTMET